MKLKKAIEEAMINKSELAREINLSRSALSNKLDTRQRDRFSDAQKEAIKKRFARIIYILDKFIKKPEF